MTGKKLEIISQIVLWYENSFHKDCLYVKSFFKEINSLGAKRATWIVDQSQYQVVLRKLISQHGSWLNILASFQTFYKLAHCYCKAMHSNVTQCYWLYLKANSHDLILCSCFNAYVQCISLVCVFTTNIMFMFAIPPLTPGLESASTA